jgi:hypothetical protein
MSEKSQQDYRPRDFAWKQYIDRMNIGLVILGSDFSDKELHDLRYACDSILLEEMTDQMHKHVNLKLFERKIEEGVNFFDWMSFVGQELIHRLESIIYLELEYQSLHDKPGKDFVFTENAICAYKTLLLLPERVGNKRPSSAGIFEQLPFIAEAVKREMEFQSIFTIERYSKFLQSREFTTFLVSIIGLDNVLMGLVVAEGAVNVSSGNPAFTFPGFRYSLGVFVYNDGRITFNKEFISRVKSKYNHEKVTNHHPSKPYREINRGCPFLPNSNREVFLKQILEFFVHSLNANSKYINL